MNKILLIAYRLFFIFLFVFTIYGISIAAVDVKGSFDDNIKIFDNCKVSLVTLKNNKKFVFLELSAPNRSFFRIVFDKYKPIGYTQVMPNLANFPDKSEKKGYANILIGSREYNVELNIVVHDRFVIYFLNMPSNFIDLLLKNKEFTIDYDNWGYDKLLPISSKGFSVAMNYVKALQASL